MCVKMYSQHTAGLAGESKAMSKQHTLKSRVLYDAYIYI